MFVGRFAIAVAVTCTMVTNGFAQGTQKSSRPGAPSKKVALEILETDRGVGGTNQFVFLRLFSDRSVEFHPKRSQSLKKDRLLRGEISAQQMTALQDLLGRGDILGLPRTFNSTFTPIDFYWTLDFEIRRESRVQRIRLVNYYPEMAVENNKPYPEALLRLACAVFSLRQGLGGDTSDQGGRCKGLQ